MFFVLIEFLNRKKTAKSYFLYIKIYYNKFVIKHNFSSYFSLNNLKKSTFKYYIKKFIE